MIIGNKHSEIIENIKNAANDGVFDRIVEIDDPVLTKEESKETVERYLKNRRTLPFKAKTLLVRTVANVGSDILNRKTEIIGFDKLKDIKGGAIITSNHFNYLDSTPIRYMVRKLGKKRINVISKDTNFASAGLIGFILKYVDTIPINSDPHYMQREFVNILDGLFRKNEFLLIYPEQEMWFNYRKPRPLKRGAYFYAAKLNVPVISCMVELCDSGERETDEFNKVNYRLHILDVLYPDSTKSLKQSSTELWERDYELKCRAYREFYGVDLDYTFEAKDIAGWVGKKP